MRVLTFLALGDVHRIVPPRQIAQEMGCSPTYLAKIAGLLVKANLLRAHRGSHGGVNLARPVEDITLLAILEACQGQLVGDYCNDAQDLRSACAFHHAMQEAHQALVDVLSRWTLADLAKRPEPARAADCAECRMIGVRPRPAAAPRERERAQEEEIA